MGAATTSGRTHSGMVTFAGVMLLLAGGFNLLDGIVALVDDDYYRVEQLLFGNLTAWGVWWVCVGLMLAGTGIAVLRRSVWGVVFGVTLAGLNAITQMAFLAVYPGWSIAAMVVDGLIIMALTTHVGDFAE